MVSERERMLRGELYNPSNPDLTAARSRARERLQRLNAAPDHLPDERRRLIRELIPQSGRDVWIEPPFACDYGEHITLGDNVFFNFHCVVLDVARVTIGNRVLCGPAVQIYAATHPLSATLRQSGLELGQPVTIGDDVWIGGGAIICPGVTIGDRAVIGAGSVVTRDVPSDVVAAGNPCRILRSIDHSLDR